MPRKSGRAESSLAKVRSGEAFAKSVGPKKLCAIQARLADWFKTPEIQAKLQELREGAKLLAELAGSDDVRTACEMLAGEVGVDPDTKTPRTLVNMAIGRRISRVEDAALIAEATRRPKQRSFDGRVKTAFEYISKNPGRKGSTIRKAIGLKSDEDFRRRIVPQLKSLGVTCRGWGYYPPKST
jgi:hypothetical protein